MLQSNPPKRSDSIETNRTFIPIIMTNRYAFIVLVSSSRQALSLFVSFLLNLSINNLSGLFAYFVPMRFQLRIQKKISSKKRPIQYITLHEVPQFPSYIRMRCGISPLKLNWNFLNCRAQCSNAIQFRNEHSKKKNTENEHNLSDFHYVRAISMKFGLRHALSFFRPLACSLVHLFSWNTNHMDEWIDWTLYAYKMIRFY